ncbi:serine/threonine-protein kinase PCRK1-like [Lactuca sativa]|uniref:serine/threonine-protein kinase PCRK1-like n=1 Tax=Lactuca sativa TaxID=4236 RepID=UPI000CD90485|nr:serine/threonine-protein kinase PCRK1-like [Lactuca sativa]
MVFSCRCFSVYFGEETEYLTIAKSSSESYHTACSEFDGKRFVSEPNFQDELPDLAERSRNPRVFTLTELKAATTNFCRSSKIRESESGSVRMGRIKSSVYPYKTIKVSVKLRNSGVLQGDKQLATEVNELWKIEHPNLVKLIGYCDEVERNGTLELIVHEYMSNGSLHDHLSAMSDAPISWARRLRVARDTACGLAYLHEGMDYSIIFRDFTPSNILLDKEWHAKLLNFGNTSVSTSEGQTHVSGYAAPEYLKTGYLTTKSNVWSYGVLLYVLITGWPPLDPHRPMNEQKLLDWVKPYLSDDKFCQIVDSRIEIDDFGLREAKRLSIIANNCLRKNIKLRPKMSRVLDMLDQLMTKSVMERASDNADRVLHEPYSSMKMKFKGKRRFECLSCICSSTK